MDASLFFLTLANIELFLLQEFIALAVSVGAQAGMLVIVLVKYFTRQKGGYSVIRDREGNILVLRGE